MVITIIALFCFLSSLVLYCCMVQGKREDEALNRLFREKREPDLGKDEE